MRPSLRGGFDAVAIQTLTKCGSGLVRGVYSRPRAGARNDRDGSFLSRVLVFGCVIAVAILGGCGKGVLDPQGPIGKAELNIIIDSSIIMLAIIVPVIVLTLGFAWWFRASNTRAQYSPDWAYSGRLEFIVWIIPLLAVIFLAGTAWIGSHQLDPAKPIASSQPTLRVQVVSLDWKWLFIYPDLGIASVNEFAVTTGTPVAFGLTSATVMNSFFVPQLGSQIYTMAGMETKLHLQADTSGRYAGISAQFSGDGFADMRFTAIASASEGFDEWVAKVRAAPAALDKDSYAALVQPSRANAVEYFGRIDPDLFHRIVMHDHMPKAAAPNADMSTPPSHKADH